MSQRLALPRGQHDFPTEIRLPLLGDIRFPLFGEQSEAVHVDCPPLFGTRCQGRDGDDAHRGSTGEDEETHNDPVPYWIWGTLSSMVHLASARSQPKHLATLQQRT